MPTHLDSIFFTVAGSYIMPTGLSAPVSGVDCPCPCPVANCLLELLFQLTLFSRSLPLPVTARFQVQNPLSGFAPKQTKESSAWRATYIVLHRGVTLTAKIYNALLLNRIRLEVEKILKKHQNGFERNRSTTSQILSICRIIEEIRVKNLEATLLFEDFFKSFDSILRRKMEQLLLAYGFLKENI